MPDARNPKPAVPINIPANIDDLNVFNISFRFKSGRKDILFFYIDNIKDSLTYYKTYVITGKRKAVLPVRIIVI